jgi:hypothetical protein
MTPEAYAANLARYDQLVATNPKVKRDGATEAEVARSG